ncbi:MAG: hypothetical protein NTW19_15070 [Planctomycetota bacterium]|nr:hypothetical protein [Planctomycetota bacterium]
MGFRLKEQHIPPIDLEAVSLSVLSALIACWVVLSEKRATAAIVVAGVLVIGIAPGMCMMLARAFSGHYRDREKPSVAHVAWTAAFILIASLLMSGLGLLAFECLTWMRKGV